MQNDIENILNEIAAKDSQVLCREVLSIGDTMDVLRSKWTVEILTAILCGNTRFKDILTAVHGLSDKVLTESWNASTKATAQPTFWSNVTSWRNPASTTG